MKTKRPSRIIYTAFDPFDESELYRRCDAIEEVRNIEKLREEKLLPLNEQTIFILSHLCFMCGQIANGLRDGGADIPKKAE
jgi:hypothetical protein